MGRSSLISAPLAARSAAVFLAAVCAFPSVGRTDSDWWLWQSPADNAEPLDLSQTVENTKIPAINGLPVGQTFRPTQNYLYRIDLMLHNTHDIRPFHVALWQWVDTDHDGVTDASEYATTVASAPLWTDVISVPGPDEHVVINLLPRVAVQAGKPYLLELGVGDPPPEWGFYASQGPVDTYPGGLVHVNGIFQDMPPNLYFDLWFKTYSSPVGAPPLATCADTGLPAPCASAPAPWENPDPPGPPSTATDYFNIIKSIADSGRASMLASDGAFADRSTLYDAFLYRATGNETYAANVVSLFSKAREYAEDHPADFFDIGEYSPTAYKWVKNSTTLNASDHTMIKKVLLRTGVDLWPDREGGVFNHAFGRALTYKMITDLIPASEFASLSACVPGPAPNCTGLFHAGQQVTSSDYTAWKAYADDRWSAFLQSYDFFEDGCMYSFLSFQMLLNMIDAWGADAVWSDPAWKALVERVYQYLTPIGALPVCGDSRGWSQYWASPIAVFEEAAKRWHDPKYRWMAQQVYDYRRTHLKDHLANGDPVQLWEALLDEIPSMCHAYFSVDPTVPAIQPAPQSEQVAANQSQVFDQSWTAAVQKIGQTFQATATPLVRFDVRVRNGGIPGPATVKLWTWKNTYAATVADVPLFAGTLDLPGADTTQVRSIFPFLAVTPGATYYVEFSRSSAFSLDGSAGGGADRYAGGSLFANGSAVPGADLWFRSYTLSNDGSKVTMRREVTTLRPSQWGVPQTWNAWGPSPSVPDKLILRSGYDSGDLYGLVNLARGEWYHGQMESGAVLNLTYRGSTLLNDSNYYDQREKDQNNLLTKRHWGGTHLAATNPMTIPLFSDYRGATVAWVGWGDPNGWNVDHQRRYYFVKNRFLIVRDRVTFNESMMASTGNIWNAHDVLPEHGANWYSVYNREPKGLDGWLFKSPEEYLQIYLVNRNPYTYGEWKIVKDENPGSPPYKFAQRWVGQAAVGQQLWFDSILLPHGSELTPGAAAANINVAFDDGKNVVLKIAVGAETWSFVDNPGGLAINAGGVSTDARYLIARTSPGGPGYLLTSQASRVDISDGPTRLIRLTWPVTTSVELTDTAAAQDTDGDGTPDAVDTDDDGDGVDDALDAMPYDGFRCRDLDGDGCDDCSTGIDDPANDGPDADGDGRCDSGDDCPAAFNPSQSDFDGDGVGDACDLNDGLIYVLGTDDKSAVEWQPEAGPTTWNVYVGDLAVLRSTGEYTQAVGSNPLANRICGVTNPSAADPGAPPVGAVEFSLVTGSRGGAEWDLGADSAGYARPNTNPCP